MIYELQRSRRYAWDLSFVMAEPVLPEGVGQDMAYPALRKLSLIAIQLMRSVDKGIRNGSALLYILPETPSEGAAVALHKLRQEFSKTGVTNPITGERTVCGVRAAHFTYQASSPEAKQGVPPAWKEVLMQLRGDLQDYEPLSVDESTPSQDTAQEEAGAHEAAEHS